MTELEVIPPYLLTHYLWQALKLNLGMSEDDYDGLVPIVPLAEEAELMDFDKPHIVYGYAESSTGSLDAQIRGNIAFVVYSENFRELSKICNLIMRLFEMGDESARRVNEYTSTIPAFVGIRFGTINTSYGEGGTPEATEGGRQSAVVNVTYDCYMEYEFESKLVESSWP